MSEYNKDNQQTNLSNNSEQNSYSYEQPRHRYKPKFPWFKTIIVALIAGIIGAMIVLGIGKLLNNTGSEHNGSSVQEASNSKGGNTLDGKNDQHSSINKMINDVSPSIV